MICPQSPSGSAIRSKQRLESGPLEVLVPRKGVDQAELPHDVEAHAIREGPALIQMLEEHSP